jgi:hypothetical protein
MEAVNKGERSTSLLNFIIVYILIVAIPIAAAYMAGTRRNAGIGTAKDVEEQKKLSDNMREIQNHMALMRKHDLKLEAMGTPSPEGWERWLIEAKKQNSRFENEIRKFCNNNKSYTDTREVIQGSACTYLDELLRQRSNYLVRLERQRGIQNQNLSMQQLRDKNEQLHTANVGLQSQINSLNAIIARPSDNRGQNEAEVKELRLSIRFVEADCDKKQADLLETYNAVAKRKKLYTSAKENFQEVAQLARNSFALQKLVKKKISEIDETMREL